MKLNSYWRDVLPLAQHDSLIKQDAKIFVLTMPNFTFTTANSTSVQLTNNQVVSWRSAYWAIVGLALNTFMQSPGIVLAFPEQSGRCLRTSPIICFVDTILIIFKYLALRWMGMGHVNSARYIAQERFSVQELDATADQPERTCWFKAVMAFGALSQAIKLLGMHGIIATQVIGMAYLVSYATIEVLMLSVGQSWRGNPISVPQDIKRFNKHLQKSTERLFLTVIQLQRIAWTWTIFSLGSDGTLETVLGFEVSPLSRTRLQLTLYVIIVASTTLCLGVCAISLVLCVLAFAGSFCTHLLSQDYRRDGENVCSIFVRMVDFFLLPPGIQPNPPSLRAKRRHFLKLLLFNLFTHGAHATILKTHFATWNGFYKSVELARLMIAWYVLMSAMLAHFLAVRVVACVCTADARQRFVLEGSGIAWLCFHFAISNVIIGTVYYAYLYDSKGTIRPAWTENLG